MEKSNRMYRLCVHMCRACIARSECKISHISVIRTTPIHPKIAPVSVQDKRGDVLKPKWSPASVQQRRKIKPIHCKTPFMFQVYSCSVRVGFFRLCGFHFLRYEKPSKKHIYEQDSAKAHTDTHAQKQSFKITHSFACVYCCCWRKLPCFLSKQF